MIKNQRDPDFLVVGTMKSGTTTLCDVLRQHPNITINNKELHFFNGGIENGFDWYRRQLCAPPNNIVGEGTPTYSFLPHVPYIISQYFPGIKLLWIFRDPVQRTYSNYLHAYKKGVESRSFSLAVQEELFGKCTERFHSYIERSLYTEQVKRYLRYFDISQMHFIILEKFIQKPKTEFGLLLDFLEVSSFNETTFTLPMSNKTSIPKMIFLFRAVNRICPHKKIRGAVHKIWPHTRKSPAMMESTQLQLQQYFYLANKELEEIIKEPLSSYWQM